MASKVTVDRHTLLALLEMVKGMDENTAKAATKKHVHVHKKHGSKTELEVGFEDDEEAEQCWATTAKDKQCKIDAAHKDGFCGSHHRMFKEGK